MGPVYDGTRVVIVAMAHTLSSPLPSDDGLPPVWCVRDGGEFSS